MKELNLYVAAINLHGPNACSKSGSGMWYICETSEKNAKKALQRHFQERNLNGSTDDIELSVQSLDSDIFTRGTCMERDEYFAKRQQKEESRHDTYQFSPKITKAGTASRRSVKRGDSDRSVIVQGAFGAPDIKVGELKDIEGVTVNGKPLSEYSTDSKEEDMER